MAHDVFVSYPHDDKAIADAAVNRLESNGIRCWIAPRDVPHGVDWAGAIIEAIGMSRMLVLVFSDATNASDHILREVRAAGDADIPIVPFKTTAADPSPALKYYIGGTHWLDAVSGPMAAHLDTLVGVVGRMLADEEPHQRPKPARPLDAVGVAERSWFSRLPRAGKAGIGAAALALIVGAAVLFSSGGDDGETVDTSAAGTVSTAVASGSTESTVTDAVTTDTGPIDGNADVAPGSVDVEIVPSLLAIVTYADDEGDMPTRVCEISGDIRCAQFPFGPAAQPVDAAFADFDEDGRLDVVFAVSGSTGDDGYTGEAPNAWCQDAGSLEWQCRWFTDYTDVAGASRGVIVSDFDGDGHQDVVFANQNTPEGQRDHAQMCLGDGGGEFACGPFVDTEHDGQVEAVGLAVVDVDDDGDDDIALVGWRYSEVCLLDGTGSDVGDAIRSGTGQTPYSCVGIDDEPGEFYSVAAGDFDGDDAIELFLTTEATPGRLCEFDSIGRAFSCVDRYPGGAGAFGSAVGEFDSSTGGVELFFSVSGQYEGGGPAVYCSDAGDGLGCRDFTEMHDNASYDVAAVDLNGDGQLDLLAVSGGSVEACFADGNGGFVCEHVAEDYLEGRDDRGFRPNYSPRAVAWAPIPGADDASTQATPPSVTGAVDSDFIEAWFFMPETLLSVEIRTSDGTSVVSTSLRTDATGAIEPFELPLDLKRGMVVLVDDGTTRKELELVDDLTVDFVDLDSRQASGTAPLGVGFVWPQVGNHQFGGCDQGAVAVPNGAWSIDFADDPCVDALPQIDYVSVSVGDDDGDDTLAHWNR